MKRSNHTNRRGSALLLTLGVLSMALVMGMCFAFSARTARQAAQVNTDQSKARLMAESGMARVLATLQDMNNTLDKPYIPRETCYSASYPLYSFKQTSRDKSAFLLSPGASPDTDQKLKTELTSGNMVSYAPIISDSGIDWSLLTSQNYNFQAITDKNGAIIGRVGFIVIDDTDKLDLNQMLTLRINSPNSPFVINDTTSGLQPRFATVYNAANTLQQYAVSSRDFQYNLSENSTGTIDNSKTATQTIRLGNSLQELWFDGRKDYYDALPGDFYGGVNTSQTKLPFTSYYHLTNTDSTTHFDSSHDYLKYTFFSGEDIEAYWDNVNKIAYQRFDLTGYEWRPDPTMAWTWNQNVSQQSGWHHATLADAQELVDKLTGNSGNRAPFYTNATTKTLAAAPKPSDAGFGIPHLSGKEQIAANMVDFCDSDSYATYKLNDADSDPSAITEEPKYVGNENVPYLNETALRFTTTKIIETSDGDSSHTPPHHTYTYHLYMNSFLELVNIYAYIGSSTPFHQGHALVRVYGTLAYSVNGTDVSVPLTDGHFPDSTWSYTHTNEGVRFVPLTPTSGSGNPAGSTSVELFVTPVQPYDASVTFKIAIERIVMLTFDGTNETFDGSDQVYDLAFWKGTQNLDIDASALEPAMPAPISVSWQVNDPRINHKSGNWTPKASAIGEDETVVASLNAKNNNTPAPSGDIDADTSDLAFTAATATDMSHTFCTAFIPNRPFASIWELGCIHTGTPFKTLDIAGTDAAITDQVKIGPVKIRRDTFNPNSLNPNAYIQLMKNINLNTTYWAFFDDSSSNYSGPASDETSLSGSISVQSSDITAACNAASGAGVYNRSETAPFFTSLATFTNKRQKDALFGRTVGLLSTHYAKYTVVLTAESLLEITVPAGTNWSTLSTTILNPLNYASRYFSIRGRQRAVAHVIHDTWNNTLEVVQITYLED